MQGQVSAQPVNIRPLQTRGPGSVLENGGTYEVIDNSTIAPFPEWLGSWILENAGLGEKDQAFAWLDRAYKDRSYYLADYLPTDARLDNLRSDPRFAERRRRVGLPTVM
ncbi:MAG TPA: hypothetical protein VI386_15475 [Candidatus Sulfotelmatobacter sp.]